MTLNQEAVKVFIRETEWYPVMDVTGPGDRYDMYEFMVEDGDYPTDLLTAAEWADFQRVMAEFDAWQEKLRELHKGHYAQ